MKFITANKKDENLVEIKKSHGILMLLELYQTWTWTVEVLLNHMMYVILLY